MIRVRKRLEVVLDDCDEYTNLRAEQARVAADRWLNQHEPNPYAWEPETVYASNTPGESWVVVYTQ